MMGLVTIKQRIVYTSYMVITNTVDGTQKHDRGIRRSKTKDTES